MKRLFFILLILPCLVGCRSSKTVSSVAEQHVTSSVSLASDSAGFSISQQLQRMVGEGTLSARIIRFFPLADSLPPVIVPDSPQPSSTPLLPQESVQQSSAQKPLVQGTLHWLFPFGQVSSITDITFHGTTLQESGSSQLNASASSDSLRGNLNIDETASHSRVKAIDRLPWYKKIILFLSAVMFCGAITLLFYRSGSKRSF